MQKDTVLVIDFGGQYSQLIVRRVRELGLYSELQPWFSAAEAIQANRPTAVILSGGPSSVLGENAPTIEPELLDGIPTLGICYGMQWMAHALGGLVGRAESREYGRRTLDSVAPGSTLNDWAKRSVWMSHGDQVLEVPPGFTPIAATGSCPIAAMEDRAGRRLAVQFHPEVTHTPHGKEILSTFLFDIACLKQNWSPTRFVEETVEALRAQIGNKKVFCATSGGVDSSVVAALLCKALGDQVTCVMVDHGLLRAGEAEMVKEEFTAHFHPKLIVLDEQERFLDALAGVTEPEEKRHIIGNLFTVVFDEHSAEIADCDFWAQGTIYPDVVESGSATAAKIKSHHNVGGMPAWFRERFTIVEPLRLLFKDEVRAVGLELGLPASLVNRQPFPGPGIAVRIVGEVTADRVRMVQEADKIFQEELVAAGLQGQVWQSYAALLGIQSVGVMGDERTYQNPIVLRAIHSEDGMTASPVPFEFEFLEHVTNRIVNEVKGINRVFYDLTSKPPATIELE